MKIFAEIGYGIVGLGGVLVGCLILFLLLSMMVDFLTGKDRLRSRVSTLELYQRSWEYCLSDVSSYNTVKECWENRPMLP